MSCDILITGTGMFAGRIALDIASTAKSPVNIVIAGRNKMRLNWLKTAGNARAAMFATPARFSTIEVDMVADGASDKLLEACDPRIVVQAASIQTSTVISDKGNRWTQLVADGGLSATAVFQSLISTRMAAAISRRKNRPLLINCPFPDVVNGIIKAMGHDVLCGTGNVAILSNVFAGAYKGGKSEPLRVIAHYQCLSAWRKPPEERSGAIAPLVYVGDQQLDNVFTTFEQCQLTPEPAIEISGASGVTLILALAAGTSWSGHAPGPDGLPGGYPVRLENNRLVLDLPNSISKEEAIAWNSRFEQTGGLVVEDQAVQYKGRLKDLLEDEKFQYSGGFDVKDLETVCADMIRLRDRLMRENT
ncbi:hypothetical protein KUG47_09070 [Falsochrobactrum sp. TDYN1]|uniref:Saccharopine dehydrogenase NADP binding domain-containing protein n=1 Tax=Falsochrobactrum tianjinense TaxID=2706015 RepID=A0A949PP58_9HYPH|nr:hypothetical protein [Falsochrobactrum sp. TDYN1]MBV2143649.1 hypothetical protein [Falsochrobactrum sp. TDYN1]